MKPMMYKPGDLVRVREDLSENDRYPCFPAQKKGMPFIGQLTKWWIRLAKHSRLKKQKVAVGDIDFTNSRLAGQIACSSKLKRPNTIVKVYCKGMI